MRCGVAPDVNPVWRYGRFPLGAAGWPGAAAAGTLEAAAPADAVFRNDLREFFGMPLS